MAKINIDDATLTFLQDLQKQMNWEEKHDNDAQASPRFWVIMDYKLEIGDEDYHNGKYNYYHVEGEEIKFDTLEDLKKFLIEHEYHESDNYLGYLLESECTTFRELWSHLESVWHGFIEVYEYEREYIVPDTMFITKEEAKKHLKLNQRHYSNKAHTYAMTAGRSPSVEKLWFLLKELNL